MALPTIDVPTYDVTIPSTGNVITVRPFTVKEEKLLLMAVETDNLDEVIKTVKQVITNCIIKGDFNIDRAPFFDIDYLFIYLRGKSVGESVEVNLKCNNTLEDGNTCNHVFKTELDVSKIEIERPEGVSETITFNTDKGVKMKYPNYAVMKRMEKNEIDQTTNLIVASIDHIFDEKGIYSSKDHSKEELKEFVEKLTEQNYNKMQEFVSNTPTFVAKLEAKCPKCGFEHKVRYSDFFDFFF